ncbi:hypothetical protein [Sporosarcina sp. 6E9]|uniref:hypothetical protein n=1 Tax=Sporosarcina sp. 6E9 TaxID=2819235 RepID=UPI001B315F5D|nr:hypothetical protein [Sporosarcina sp. 6E9]
MDVKYVPADWEKMKSGIGNLIGLGVYGKGMIDDLKDISSNLEDAESAVERYDSDGVISFKHTDRKNTYQNLFEDFKVLHRFTGKVGDIVDRTIDQPFYEDIDAFVAEVQQLSISNYKTKNRIGVTRIVHLPGSYESTEVLKTEVGLDDLFSGDSFYAEQMKLEFEAWKQLNADQDITREEYQMGILNTRAFGYESIRNQQENKEFWVNIAALVVIVGVAIVCPPAGLALGAVYGSLELKSAISGEDWVSGRELGTTERWLRGALSPLDLVPGAVGIKRFSGAVRTANLGGDLGQLGVKSSVKASLQTSLKHVDDMVVTAGKQATTRLKSAGAAVKDTSKEVQIQLLKRGVEAGKLADTTITAAKNILPSRQMGLATDQLGTVHIPAENTHFYGNAMKDRLSKIEGLNVGGKGVGTVGGAGSKYKDTLKYEYNMIENPGPLAKLDSKPINNFYGGKYNAKELQEDLILYRAGESGGLTIAGKEKNALGQWFTNDRAESVAKVRIDLAVKSQWVDPKTGVLTGTSPLNATYKIKIPKGTTIYEGPVGFQGGAFSGGMDINQTFVHEPWKIKGLEVLEEIPLK